MVWSTQTNPLYCTWGWFKESARLILPYRLNTEPNHKMPNYSSYVFKALFSFNLWGSIKDQINNLATGTFHNWHTCCSENHLNWLTLKTCEKVICSYQTWKCEKVFICIFRWQTFTYAVYKQMLVNKEGGGWESCDGNDDENLAHISNPQHSSLEESP